MTPRRMQRQAGFTLLEVIIAMTVLALVAGICYAAFHLGIRAVERGEAAVVTAQRLRVATDVMIRQVKSTVAQPALVDEDTYPYCVGSPTSFSFVTTAGQLSGGGRARVTYRLNPDPPQLVLEESPHFTADSLGSGTPEAGEPHTAVLLDGFKTLAFHYLYDDGSESEWRSSWDCVAEEVLPNAIRIEIEGLAGLEEGEWGQEIPIMAGAFGEGGLELGGENDVAECDELGAGGGPGEGGTPGSGGTAGSGKAGNGHGGGGGGTGDGDNEDDGGDEE
ncbi:MAG TPA: prepilin-type N-terminal cleavage/methylation domain-containing protein [Candidatus Eisenbacteria bacterium]|nr:prepilin-type N-terminal cleavage/methylation domain-containing protein [Candidatus Eisenbacteria bacterium]